MKKTLLLLMLCSSFALSTFAQDKAADLKRLLEVMQVEKMIEEQINNMIPMIKQQIGTRLKNENNNEVLDTYIAFLMEETKSMANKLANKEMMDIYAKYFTHEEIKDLIKFYESPIGEKILEKTPKITAEMMTSMSIKYLPEFQERLKDKLIELMENK